MGSHSVSDCPGRNHEESTTELNDQQAATPTNYNYNYNVTFSYGYFYYGDSRPGTGSVSISWHANGSCICVFQEMSRSAWTSAAR